MLLAARGSVWDAVATGSCIDQLLDAGFPVDGADARGCTPLHICRCSHTADLLTRGGASVRTLCGAGATPLHWAAGAGRLCAPNGSPHAFHRYPGAGCTC